MKPLLVAVNAGNTHTTLALMRDRRVLRQATTSTRAPRPVHAKALADLLRGASPVRALLASVVPAAGRIWSRLLTDLDLPKAPLHLHHRLNLGVPLRYPHPERLGADRLANVAASARRHPACPVIAVDIGTATTMDVLHPVHGFIGGLILAGPEVQLSYLHERTALLPLLSPEPVRRLIGRSTEEAMRAGAWHGYRAMILELAAQIRRQPGLAGARLLVTGGGAAMLAGRRHPGLRMVPHLTLEGLAVVHALNPSSHPARTAARRRRFSA